MAGKQKKQHKEEEIRLKPLFGMRPQLYLFIAAIIIVSGGVLWTGWRVIQYPYRYTFVSAPPFATLSIVGQEGGGWHRGHCA